MKLMDTPLARLIERQQDRHPAGHTRFDGASDVGDARSVARLCDRCAVGAGLGRRAPAQYGDSLSGIDARRTTRSRAGEWDVTDNNRKARFYHITPAGRRRLANERADWARMVSIMNAVLGKES